MDNVDRLKQEVDGLQTRLDEERQKREEMERRCELLERIAHRDPATGLRTEAYMRARVREEVERATRYPAAATLVTFCPAQANGGGSSELGLRMAEDLRATDQVYDLHGSGVAVLLVETPKEGAYAVISRLQADLENFLKDFGVSVTSFPVDTNVAGEFLDLAMQRHESAGTQMRSGAANGEGPPHVN
jgi:GGDEF domain-containing protein